MAYMKVELPFGRTLHITVCEICGSINDQRCLKISVLETPKVKELDIVTTYRTPYNNKGEALMAERNTIKRIFYSVPGEFLGYDWTLRGRRDLPLHTLCVELAQSLSFDGEEHQYRPWKPGDSSLVSIRVTYADFLLLREGNREKLKEAGIIRPAKKP